MNVKYLEADELHIVSEVVPGSDENSSDIMKD